MSTNKKTIGFQSRLPDMAAILERTSGIRKNVHAEPPSCAEWEPLAKITEDKRDFHIEIDLSEVNKEKLKVVVEKGILTISGERNFVMGEELVKFSRITMVSEHFALTFILPEHTNVEKVNAEFKEGLLKVRLSKNEDPERIEALIS
jgi:HSP20 family protein